MISYHALTQRLCWILALGLSAFEFYTVGFGVLSPFAQRATMLVLAAVLIILLHPTDAWPTREPLARSKRVAAAGWDFFLLAVAVVTCSYLILNEAALADRSGAETDTDLLIAALGPLVVLDMVRRVAGIPLLLISIVVVIYGYLGDVVLIAVCVAAGLYLLQRFLGLRFAVGVLVLLLLSLASPAVRDWLDPSSFTFSGMPHNRLAAYLWLTADGTFGTITAIMTEFIFIFILFSAILESTGAGKILMDLAFALTARYRGGPAQAAVVASSMFGMVSGSTMANVVSTGTFTIPLMIRTGFSRAVAGAIEAVASCGGQIMPPIMGASVFIMAEIIGVPYVKLMLYGLLPALLFFACLSSSIYFEASRLGMQGMNAQQRAELPSAWDQVRRGGYLLVPVFILLASIVSGETPGRAGFKAVVSLLVMVDLVRSLSWVRHRSGNAGVITLACVLASMLAFAYGPMTLPQPLAQVINVPFLGEIGAPRLAMFAVGLLFAFTPRLQGLPFGFVLALAIARWEFPSELYWLGQIPYVGLLLPIALSALIVALIALPVWARQDTTGASKSAKEFGRAVTTGFEKGAKTALSLIAATSCIGLIVGLLVLSAVGIRISVLVTQIGSYSLFLALILVMIASLIMGMGLPTIAAYLLLVIVVAPALNDLGTSIVAAHMFIFYFGVISSITPPVALAAYGASGISGADPMRTGFVACRLAITAFIAPFLFTFYPELLLLEGSFTDVAYRLLVCLAGILLVGMAAMGHGLSTLGTWDRCVLLFAGILLFVAPWWLNGVGALLAVAHLAHQRRRFLATRQTTPHDSLTLSATDQEN
jgi:TRAP transporter 4TM/12TM fusion protein